MDEASGSGWMRLSSDDTAEGVIAIHRGDRSRFAARRVPPPPDDASGKKPRRRR
jgi:hypothetical protein